MVDVCLSQGLYFHYVSITIGQQDNCREMEEEVFMEILRAEFGIPFSVHLKGQNTSSERRMLIGQIDT
jgi:hypothetical protein